MFVSFGIELTTLRATYKNVIVVKDKAGVFTFSNFRTDVLVELVYF